ncbi:hypothetical protein DFH09DRAFT_1105914 [Mycena vulgaris]|nr:hypothetical protein DFH09DRAFT_1105914 [Mycena vulgaris]
MSSSRSYHPYHSSSRANFRGPKPLLSLPPPESSWLLDAFHQLKLFNDNGVLVTWGHGISNQWDEVPRPQRVTNHEPVDIAASGFKKIWGVNNSPFFCPHTQSNGKQYRPLALSLGGTHEGGSADFFHAKDHNCAFRVVVKPLKEPQYLTSWDDRHRYQEANQGDFEEEDECSEGPSSSQPSSSSASFPPSSSPPSSQSSSSSTSSINSIIASLRVQAMLLPDPRISTVPIRALPRRPTSIGGGTALEGERRLNPFYKLSVANARKTADVELMEYLHQIDSSGVLQDDPESHPAWDTNNFHRVLQVYDSRIYPQCLLRTNDFLQYLYKPVGQAIRELNCALGIPFLSMDIMLIFWMVNARITLISAQARSSLLSDRFVLTFLVVDTIDSMDDNTFHFRSFRDDKHPKKVGETLDTAVGSALLE